MGADIRAPNGNTRHPGPHRSGVQERWPAFDHPVRFGQTPQREAWIQNHSDVNVLITNPHLVQTGLDLVSFATVVFFEVEYSLYTLWQVLRWVWRQAKLFNAVFVVYKDTMEAQVLTLMGRKMRAVQTLYGDGVRGAIVPVEEGDFITELAREVLQGAEPKDLQSLFADEMKVSKLAVGQRHSPMGCPTEVSPVLVPVPGSPNYWMEWVKERQVQKGRSKRNHDALPGQLEMWNLEK